MTESHITSLLDSKPFSEMNDVELSTVDAHIASCSQCRSAFDASKIAGMLIEARAGETIEPSPFFKTRIMSEIRSRHLSPEEPALVRIWETAGGLVTTLTLFLMLLVGLTVFPTAPSPDMTTEVRSNLYSPEYVVLARGDLEDELVNDQVLETIYELEDSSDGQ